MAPAWQVEDADVDRSAATVASGGLEGAALLEVSLGLGRHRYTYYYGLHNSKICENEISFRAI
jgi:hypothetical protein